MIWAGETRGIRIQSAGTGNPVGGGALGAKEEEGAALGPAGGGSPESEILKHAMDLNYPPDSPKIHYLGHISW